MKIRINIFHELQTILIKKHIIYTLKIKGIKYLC